MKRLLLILALVLAPAALFAQVADRDVLLTPDGTLYTIESKSAIEGETYEPHELFESLKTLFAEDFQDHTRFTPGDPQPKNVTAMLDELVAHATKRR